MLLYKIPYAKWNAKKGCHNLCYAYAVIQRLLHRTHAPWKHFKERTSLLAFFPPLSAVHSVPKRLSKYLNLMYFIWKESTYCEKDTHLHSFGCYMPTFEQDPHDAEQLVMYRRPELEAHAWKSSAGFLHFRQSPGIWHALQPERMTYVHKEWDPEFRQLEFLPCKGLWKQKEKAGCNCCCDDKDTQDCKIPADDCIDPSCRYELESQKETKQYNASDYWKF